MKLLVGLGRVWIRVIPGGVGMGLVVCVEVGRCGLGMKRVEGEGRTDLGLFGRNLGMPCGFLLGAWCGSLEGGECLGF